MQNIEKRMEWFVNARYGMFIHFGLYSLLARGEWAMNREQIPPDEYRKLADRFKPDRFDADAVCRLAAESGMKYVVFTTKHHEGFRLYNSALSDFTSTKTAAGRDFTAEMITAARKHGLRIGLYHSLNNWFDQPDGVAALESKAHYETFIHNTFERIRELVTRYNPVDMLWYDGWWPYHATGWRAEAMNAMVRSIQPGIVINGRNGLPGDFASPEQHLTAPSPWRPWEACMTLNDHWGCHRSDENWKSSRDVVKMLTAVANRQGNLLLNVGPRGDGSVPGPSERILREVGTWIRTGGGEEALWGVDKFTFDYEHRGDHRSDWDLSGIFTARGRHLHVVLRYFPGPDYVLAGLETEVRKITVDGRALDFVQEGGKVRVALPADLETAFCPVLRFECAAPPSIYRTGGMRTPRVPHPPYDPCPSDIGE